MEKFIEIFWKTTCGKCNNAMQLGKKLKEAGYNVRFFNVEELNGLTEASFHTVMSTPTIIIVDELDNLLKDWRSDVPDFESVVNELKKEV